MQIAHPYHAGEIAVQEATGERGSADRNGRAISDSIMPGALKFVNQRSMVILGSLSRDGQVWCSLLTGALGFVTAPDQRRVVFDLTNAGSHENDPLWENIVHDEQIGMLAIDLATRRRLRVNGTLRRAGGDRYELDVSEAYPNCPQYIQRRNVVTRVSDATDTADHRLDEGTTIVDEHVRLIQSADTLFVASAHSERGADASHRGGAPGFVRVVERTRLRVPDYPGNSMFNTLGNLRVNPRAGLLFPDFRRGRTLQLTGSATIDFNAQDDPAHSAGGTGRYWDFAIDRWIEAPMQYPLEVEFLDAWPKNPKPANGDTGGWAKGYATGAHQFETPSSTARAEVLAKPALAIWGEQDRTLHAEHFLALFEQLFPHAPVHRLAGAGHYSTEDAPDAVAQLVVDFLRDTQDRRVVSMLAHPSASHD